MKAISEIYSLVIESLIIEEDNLQQIYNTYYKNDVEDFETFKKIVEVDPTSTASKKGKYVDWLIRQAYKADREHFFEDSYKTKEDLKTFDKNFNKIKKQISQIKDSHELYDIVKDFQEKVDKGEIDLSRSEIKAGAEKIYDDGQWLIVHPKTKEAATYYGANTRWCTAAEKDNKFDYYNKLGPLYILINRKDPKEKYQFHFETEQYMDSEDAEIVAKIYDLLPTSVLDELISLAPNAYKAGRFISNLYYNFKKRYPECLKTYKLAEECFKSIREGYLPQLKVFVNKGADITVENNKMLRLAIYYKNPDIAKFLIEKGADIHLDNEYPLKYALQSGQEDMAKYLITHGADVTVNDNYIIRDFAYDKDLDINMIKLLIEYGADIHVDDDVLLVKFAYNNNLEMVKYLISKGASLENALKSNHFTYTMNNKDDNRNTFEYLRSLKEIK